MNTPHRFGFLALIRAAATVRAPYTLRARAATLEIHRPLALGDASYSSLTIRVRRWRFAFLADASHSLPARHARPARQAFQWFAMYGRYDAPRPSLFTIPDLWVRPAPLSLSRNLRGNLSGNLSRILSRNPLSRNYRECLRVRSVPLRSPSPL